jgi:hypothetical protein
MADWKHNFIECINYIPFLVTSTRTNGLPSGQVNLIRVLESLIIAGITGAIVMYGVQIKLDEQMAGIKTQMAELKARMAEDRAHNISRIDRVEDRMAAMHGMAGGK